MKSVRKGSRVRHSVDEANFIGTVISISRGIAKVKWETGAYYKHDVRFLIELKGPGQLLKEIL